LIILKAFQQLGYHISGSAFSRIIAVKNENSLLYLRRRTSDLQVAEQIFIREEYKASMELIRACLNLDEKPNIIDAGANIGCSALYFSAQFPMAQIAVLEPFSDNFKLLKRNLEENKVNFNAYQAALWSGNAFLDFDMGFRDGQEWSVRTVVQPAGKVKSIGLNDLFQDLKNEHIDILKVDIEGSEFEVFLNSSSNLSCLKKVRSMVMEIHDDAGDRQSLYSVFEADFETHELGELTLFLNKHFLKA
jgi:FkbM family methyltransferase